MPNYDPNQIANLVGQLGGDHQQAAQQLQQMGGQIDPQQHADTLQQMGIDPQRLQNGDYQQHLDAQDQPGFQGYQSGDMSGQAPQFGQSGMGQNQSGMNQGGMNQSGMGSQDQNGQNFQQFDQGQGGMRGMEPDQDQQLDDGRQMSGQQGSQQQDYSDQQNQ
ncbi:hypothetical protein [Catenulispora rubra]|uniref:hypothetical protein n=1 Tax=Catenulispora rubra TaxID=280293 RepID=UPI0018920CBF|nr:hypothetical protein [Catenulispora rubra]